MQDKDDVERQLLMQGMHESHKQGLRMLWRTQKERVEAASIYEASFVGFLIAILTAYRPLIQTDYDPLVGDIVVVGIGLVTVMYGLICLFLRAEAVTQGEWLILGPKNRPLKFTFGEIACFVVLACFGRGYFKPELRRYLIQGSDPAQKPGCTLRERLAPVLARPKILDIRGEAEEDEDAPPTEEARILGPLAKQLYARLRVWVILWLPLLVALEAWLHALTAGHH